MDEKDNFRTLLPNDIEELKDIIELQKSELVYSTHKPIQMSTIKPEILAYSSDYVSVDFHYGFSKPRKIK